MKTVLLVSVDDLLDGGIGFPYSPAMEPPSSPHTLGMRVRLTRTSRRLTQKALAAQVGLSPAALANIEYDRSDPRVSHLRAIAAVLRVSTDYLLGLSDGAPP